MYSSAVVDLHDIVVTTELRIATIKHHYRETPDRDMCVFNDAVPYLFV